jgi:hypothetical protein
MNFSREEIFTDVYQKKLWAGDNSIPLSGPGSKPDYAKPYVDFVADIVTRLETKSVLDIGHGDWEMWREYKFENTNYIGVDLASDLSESNNKRYGSKNRQFLQIQFQDLLPDAELLLCKDVLQHLSNKDVKNLLLRFSAYKYLIICNDFFYTSNLAQIKHNLQIRSRIRKILKLKSPFYLPGLINNRDIETGGYRSLDLTGEFFSSEFQNFELLESVDYKSEHENEMVKRILFFRNLDEGSTSFRNSVN